MATKRLDLCNACGSGTYIIYPSQEIVCVQCGAIACCNARLETVKHEDRLTIEQSLEFWRETLPAAPEKAVILAVAEVERFFMTKEVLTHIAKQAKPQAS